MIEQSLPVEGPMHSPPHPGQIVRQDCIEPLGLSIGEAAEALGVTHQTLDRLANERGGISAEMALHLAKAFGSTPEMCKRLQTAFDLADARNRSAKELAAIRQVEWVHENIVRPKGGHKMHSASLWRPVLHRRCLRQILINVLCFSMTMFASCSHAPEQSTNNPDSISHSIVPADDREYRPIALARETLECVLGNLQFPLIGVILINEESEKAMESCEPEFLAYEEDLLEIGYNREEAANWAEITRQASLDTAKGALDEKNKESSRTSLNGRILSFYHYTKACAARMTVDYMDILRNSQESFDRLVMGDCDDGQGQLYEDIFRASGSEDMAVQVLALTKACAQQAAVSAMNLLSETEGARWRTTCEPLLNRFAGGGYRF